MPDTFWQSSLLRIPPHSRSPPESSNFTPGTCSAKLSGAVMEKKRAAPAELRWSGSFVRERGVFPPQNTKDRGVAVANSTCKVLDPRAPLRLHTLLLRKAPKPQSPGDQTLTEAGDHQPAGRATTFLSPPLLVPEWPRTPSRPRRSRPHSPLYAPVQRNHAAATATSDPAVRFPPG